MGEEEQHGCDRDCNNPKRQTVKREEKKQEKNGQGCDDDEEKKSSWNALGAQRESFVTVGTGLIGDFEQMLMGPGFRVVCRLRLNNGCNDVGEQIVGALGVFPTR